MRSVNKLLIFTVISLVISLLMIASLVIFGTASVPSEGNKTLAFDELYFDYSSLPPLQRYVARDSAQLDYRHYDSASDFVLVLVHGSGWHSRYFLPLANALASQNLAQVYTPDLRGHGESPKRRGDIDYIEQFEDDLADFIKQIRSEKPEAKIIVGGHSSGGGLALRFAGSQYGAQADGYLLLAPFLKYNAPTVRENSGGWAVPYTGRIIGLSMLNAAGFRYFNDLRAIEFAMPMSARDGTETLAYSYRLNTGFAPRDYQADLKVISQPLLLLVGDKDEAFKAQAFDSVIKKHASNTDAEVEVIPNVTHMGIVVGEEVQASVAAWLKKLKNTP